MKMKQEETSEVEFNATPRERKIITLLAIRAIRMAHAEGIEYEFLDAIMDIEACHSNGCPLDLDKLALSDDANFGHDILGIRRHMNRTNGKLMNHFLPRCAKSSVSQS